MYECRRVPPEIRKAVVAFHKRENLVPGRLRYGSRKRFFTHIWKLLKSAKFEDLDQQEIGEGIPVHVIHSTKEDDAGAREAEDKVWKELLKGSDLVDMNDRHLVPDILLGTMAQMKRTKVLEQDRIGRCKNHPIDFTGMSCKWCGGKAGKPGEFMVCLSSEFWRF